MAKVSGQPPSTLAKVSQSWSFSQVSVGLCCECEPWVESGCGALLSDFEHGTWKAVESLGWDSLAYGLAQLPERKVTGAGVNEGVTDSTEEHRNIF